ncbi:MAG: hypothetical protein E6G36_07160, partial [Actinobacteria bacterium]
MKALDVARPPEARLLLLEPCLLQVVLECAVCLRRLVAKRKADDEVDVGRSDMRAGAFRELADEVSRRETACEVDAFTPRAEVAKQGDQDALAECSGFLVVVRVM